MNETAARIVALLKEYHLTVSTAESCTGGWIAKEITEIPGASTVFPGSIVSYCDTVKQDLLGVDGEILQMEGAVSANCAKQMAIGVARKMNTDFGIATTGYAGPGDEQTGLVFLAVATGDMAMVRQLHLEGTREEIRKQVVDHALCWLLSTLTELGEMTQ